MLPSALPEATSHAALPTCGGGGERHLPNLVTHHFVRLTTAFRTPPQAGAMAGLAR